MEHINVKFIHPTNQSDIDIGLMENKKLQDVFTQLIDANFLNSSHMYTGVLKPSGERQGSTPLDNDKTIIENGVGNNDTIQIYALIDGGSSSYVKESAGNKTISYHRFGIPIDKIPSVNLPKLLNNPDFSLVILHELMRIESENIQWKQKQQIEYQTLCDERIKLQNELQMHKGQLVERKIATILFAVAPIVVALGAAYVTTNTIPSIATIIGGTIMTIAALLISIKKVK